VCAIMHIEHQPAITLSSFRSFYLTVFQISESFGMLLLSGSNLFLARVK